MPSHSVITLSTTATTAVSVAVSSGAEDAPASASDDDYTSDEPYVSPQVPVEEKFIESLIFHLWLKQREY